MYVGIVQKLLKSALFTSKASGIPSLDMIERDWNKFDFNQLNECREVLSHCDNNNGAMVVVITEDARDYYHPKYKLGFLLGPEDVEGEPPFSRWVTTDSTGLSTLKRIS